jgi:hypothetical protein
MDKPECGSESFADLPLGARGYAFRHWLTDNFKTFDIDCLAVEAPLPLRSKTNQHSIRWLYFANGIVHTEAHDWQMQLAEIGVGTWRSYFIGHAHAPKEIVGQNERRKWLKGEVLSECRARGNNPYDDNAADALGLLYYVKSCVENELGIFMEAA